MPRFTTTSPEETMALGRRLGALLAGGQVVAFTGGLGAGKTTFCRGLAQGLGSVDPVSSPTFAITNLYRGRVPFAHFDAYRLDGPEDLEAAGFYDHLDAGAVVAVEWSERLAGALPAPLVSVDIAGGEDDIRHITIEGAEL